jgi:hypothetical protein
VDQTEAGSKKLDSSSGTGMTRGSDADFCFGNGKTRGSEAVKWLRIRNRLLDSKFHWRWLNSKFQMRLKTSTKTS